MKKRRYKYRCWFVVLALCAVPLSFLHAAYAVSETDSLKSVLSQTTDARVIIPTLFRLANLNEQKKGEIAYLERCYAEANKIDSLPAMYLSLENLARYYYNDGNRDSLLYWGAKVDSLSKRYNEYPNVLFAVKSYLCQDLLWSHNYELALNEALNEYQLASSLKHSYGLLRCSESLGLIYQALRRDSDAVVVFQEGLDLVGKADCPEDIRVETKMRITCYQAESAIDFGSEQTKEILDRYKEAIDAMGEMNKRNEKQVSIGRDYWLLYCYYSDFYVKENKLAEARNALDNAAKYVGSNMTEGDYVQNTYLAAQAYYYRKAGDIPKALHFIDEVFKTECVVGDLQFKADILQEQGRLKEALALYDELYKQDAQRNKETFFRQIGQLRTLHELNNQEEQEYEMQLNEELMEQKQQLILFFSFVALILLYLLYILFRYYQRTRRLKNELLNEKQSLLKSENDLKHEQLKAEEASRMKSAFVANMSHEIRTPLNAIVGFSSLLVEEDDPEEREEYAAVIHNNTDQLLNLVNDVLDLSRMETGDLSFKFDYYPLLECCQSALDSVRHRIPQGVELTFTPDSIPVVLYTDTLRLQQVLTNLLTNSAKFTKKGEINLAFKVDDDGKRVRISVTDTGCGIPKEKQEAVFHRFEKLDDYKAGVGLGLSICTLIADRLDGTLIIDSTYENGARFIFTHPCGMPSSTCNRQTGEVN